MDDKEQLEHIVFLHIPKTAGTTLVKILRRQYGRKYSYPILGNLHESVVAFTSKSQVDRDCYRLIRGHWPFGLHEYFSGKTKYISVMRDPLERLISLYYYIKRIPSHYLYEQVTSRNLSLDEFLTGDLSAELDNGQLRLLAGCEKTVPVGGIRQEHLDLAKNNIENHFAVVGLTKRFDETLLLYKHMLGWKRYPYYHRLNVTASRPPVEAATPETIKFVLQRNRFEVELFDWVSERFEQQIAEFPGDFEAGLTHFQKRNGLYQQWTIDVRKPKWMLRLEQGVKS